MSDSMEFGARKQLFIDDRFLARQYGMQLAVNPPLKAKRVLWPETPGETTSMGLYSTFLEDDGIYKLWYDAYVGVQVSEELPRSLCYATSEDGIHWQREDVNRFVAIDSWGGTIAAWRGAAINLFNAGADGIYTFNAFSPRHDIWREIGDPKTMENKDKIFGVDRFAGDSSFKDVRELELKRGEPVSVQFQVGEDVKSGNSHELQLLLHFWDFAHIDDIAVKLNHEPLKEFKPTGPVQTPLAGQWLECPLNPAQVKRGENRVELMVSKLDESMPTPLVLDAVQLHVRHKG